MSKDDVDEAPRRVLTNLKSLAFRISYPNFSEIQLNWTDPGRPADPTDPTDPRRDRDSACIQWPRKNEERRGFVVWLAELASCWLAGKDDAPTTTKWRKTTNSKSHSPRGQRMKMTEGFHLIPVFEGCLDGRKGRSEAE